MLTVLRDDIASVSARLVTMARPNDEEVTIPANGFSLAATISRPCRPAAPAPAPGRKPAPVRLPAVVLVSGSGPTDRDEFVAGIPIFAQLANALADAGYLVVRYDERGAGQSGGRQESATIEEFAVDARAVVAYLMKRRDVDPKKISLVGYGEGGWIALVVGARDQKIAAIGLIATPSTPGTELVLEQQRLMFEGSSTSPAVQQSAIEQQKKILEAVVTGKGWEEFQPRHAQTCRHAALSQLPDVRAGAGDCEDTAADARRAPDARSRSPGVSRRTACAARALAPSRAERPSSSNWPASIICSRERPRARPPNMERSRNAASARPPRWSSHRGLPKRSFPSLRNKCGPWRPMIRLPTAVTFRLPPGSVKTIGRSPGAEFIDRSCAGFAAALPAHSHRRRPSGEGPRQHQWHVRQRQTRKGCRTARG